MHEMSVDDYRRAHELPRTRGLHAADILERRAALARAGLEADPDGYIAHRLTPKHTSAAERTELSRAARTESAGRAGVKAALAGNAVKSAQTRQRSIAASFEDLAEDMGFPGIPEMLAAMADLDTPALGRHLGISKQQAARLRARYGFSSPGRWPAGYVPTSPAHRPRVSAEELALLPAGVQPERDGELLCRDCGQWVVHLGRHVARGHKKSLQAYQATYGIDPDLQRAVELGYADVAEMLSATADLGAKEFASLLGIDLRRARKVRARHGFRALKARPRIPLVTSAELAALPAGVQPEGHGKLLCRDCGGWYRGLSAHLANKHGVDAANYRERHGLAISARLESQDVQERRIVNGRERWASDLEFQKALRPTRTTSAERIARMAKARQAGSVRPGAQAVRQEVGARLGRVLPNRIREEYEERARQLSYDSIADLLAATADLSGADLARLLGIAPHRARELRRRHGVPSPAPRARNRKIEGPVGLGTPERLSAADLAAMAPGVQPQTERWLACRDCGGWYGFLGKHVVKAHGGSPAEYRARHKLPPDLPLHFQVRSKDVALTSQGPAAD